MVRLNFKLFQNVLNIKLKAVNPNFNSISRKYATPAPAVPPVLINPHTSKLFQDDDVATYNSVFPLIKESIKKQAADLPEVSKRFEKILNLVLPHPMLIEGLKVPAFYKVIDPPERRTQEKVFLSNILGWCVDLLCTSMQINDDILDGSEVRWDYPCLYKQKDIHLQAINDAVLMENLPYAILKEFCSNYPWYTSALDLMHDVSIKIAYGHTLEDMCKIENHPRFDIYTNENYSFITKYRADYPAFILPTMFATFCSGNYDNDLPKKAEKVFSELGKFMAVQDEMIDDYESRLNPSIASDISVGQMTWLICQALERASPSQKFLIYQHYAKADSESVSIIHNLYDELNINDAYQEYKDRSYDYICETNENLNIREEHKRGFYKLIEILYEKGPL